MGQVTVSTSRHEFIAYFRVDLTSVRPCPLEYYYIRCFHSFFISVPRRSHLHAFTRNLPALGEDERH